jgi:hypothetical protein
MTDKEECLELYAVRNKEGLWFHKKGYGGRGKTWVDNIKSARIYANIKGAKSRVTYFSNHWPDYGTPDIVKLTVTKFETINMEKETKKKKERKEIATAKRIQAKKEKILEEAREELKDAEDKVRKLLLDQLEDHLTDQDEKS